MIRLRLERFTEHMNPDGFRYQPIIEGLVFYEGGLAVGRVIIEQETIVSEGGKRYETWSPVEVIDES